MIRLWALVVVALGTLTTIWSPSARSERSPIGPIAAPPAVTSEVSAAARSTSAPVGDLPGWRQVFVDGFDEDVALGSFPSAVSDRWGAYDDGWKDSTGHGAYFPSKVVSIDDGVLRMHVHSENDLHLVAALVPKLRDETRQGANGLLYGRYAVRFRADPLPGYKVAWLLWPDSEQWPRDGEIDFPEGDLDGLITGAVHHQHGSSGDDQDTTDTEASFTSWHTTVIEWTPDSVTFMLDGAVVGTSTRRIPNTPMHWVLQTETSLKGPAPAADTAGDVEIDWVAAWARA